MFVELVSQQLFYLRIWGILPLTLKQIMDIITENLPYKQNPLYINHIKFYNYEKFY